MNYRFCLVMIIVSMIISSCRTGKEVYTNRMQENTRKEINISSIETKKNYNNSLKIGSLDVCFKMNGNEDKFKARIAIKRDTFMVISLVPVAGIEVMRIYCTMDSIIVLNRREKTFTCEDFKQFEERYGIRLDLTEIMAICSNEFFLYDHVGEYVINDRYEDKVNGIMKVEYLKKEEQNHRIKQVVSYSTINGTIDEVEVTDDKENLRMNIKYSNFNDIAETIFPGIINVKIEKGKNLMMIEMEVKKIEMEQDVNIKIDIPVNYIRTEL